MKRNENGMDEKWTYFLHWTAADVFVCSRNW
jgi:hypothetical protein